LRALAATGRFLLSELLRIKASAINATALIITGKRCGTARFTRARYSRGSPPALL